MLKLHIASLDDAAEADTVTVSDLVKDFERKVASRYVVVPVLSDRAYEEFRETETGNLVRITHRSFGRRSYGSLNELALAVTLLDDLWGEVKQAFPAGETVIWRRLPEVVEYYDDEECAHCHHVYRDRPQVKVTFRLGCSLVIEQSKWLEGQPIPFLGEQE